MNITWDLVTKSQAWPPALGEYVRVTFDIPTDECNAASIAAHVISELTSYVPWVGALVSAQFTKSANEIVARNEGLGVIARIYMPIAGVGIAFNEVDTKRPTSSIAKGPFSDLAVEVLDGHDHRGLDESGWQRLIVDLNMGAGGKFLYLKCKPFEPGDPLPIAEVVILSSKKNDISTPAGFTRVPVDLNLSVKGKYIFVFYRRGEPALDALAVVAADHRDVAPPEGFVKIDVDLNEGAKGKFIYLCYQHPAVTVGGPAPTPKERHQLTPGEMCDCGKVHHPLPHGAHPL